MIECVSNETFILLYADDNKIWQKIRSLEDHYTLQCDIDALNAWATENKMKFHVGKCKVLPIFPQGKEYQLRDLFDKIYLLNNIFITVLMEMSLNMLKLRNIWVFICH